MSKITDEANRIIRLTNDSNYMEYSFVSEAQQQAVNVLNLNKEIEKYKQVVTAAKKYRDFDPLLTEVETEADLWDEVEEALNQLSEVKNNG